MSEQQEEKYAVCQLPTEYGRLCSRGCHVMAHTKDGKTEIVEYDYPAAAGTIALYLREFCDTSLAYPAMIAEASRRAARTISALRQERDAVQIHISELQLITSRLINNTTGIEG